MYDYITKTLEKIGDWVDFIFTQYSHYDSEQDFYKIVISKITSVFNADVGMLILKNEDSELNIFSSLDTNDKTIGKTIWDIYSKQIENEDFISRNINDANKIEQKVFQQLKINNFFILHLKTIESLSGILFFGISEIEIEPFFYPFAKNLAIVMRYFFYYLNIHRKLKENINRYSTLFEKSEDALLLIEDNRFIDCNEKATQLFGLSKKEIIGLTPYDLSPRYQDDDQLSETKALTYINQALNGKSIFFEWKHLKNKKTPIDTQVKLNFFKTNGKKLIQTIIRDISKQKKYEQKIKKDYERYNITINAINDSIVVLDINFSIQISNEKFNQTFNPNKIKDFSKIYSNNKKLLSKISEVFKTGKSTILQQKFSLNGETKWFEYKISPFNNTKSSNYVILMILDISKQKKYEKEILEKSDLLNTILNSISAGIIVTDLDGKIILANEQSFVLTGWNTKNILGKNFKEILNFNYKPQNLINTAINNKKEFIIENFQLKSELGQKIDVNITISPLINNAGMVYGIVITLKDISNLKQIEEEHLKVNKLKSLGVLAGGIAHDFNNILTGILGNISLLKTILFEDYQLDDDSFGILNETEKAARRATGLTSQLLTFSKGGTPVIKDLSIKHLLVENTKFSLTGSSISVQFDVYDRLWMIKGDKNQLSQIISNLVINAKDAMHNKGQLVVRATNISFDKDCQIYNLKSGKYVKIEIEDNGKGIKKEIINKIFDPYFTTKDTGQGLGLAMVYSIIKKHNGFIKVESVVGKGTVFTMYLPAIGKISSEMNLVTSLKSINPPKRILILDDEEIILRLLTRIFKKQGFEVVCTKKGEETLKEYEKSIKQNQKFDVLILDLTIPDGMEGLEVTSKIRKFDKNVIILASSGYVNSDIMSNYTKYGFNDILQKPYSINDVLNKLNKF